VDDIFNEMDANGDGSISKDEMTAFQSTAAAAPQSGAAGSTSNSTSTQTAGATGLTSFVQQAISKYLQLTPGGLIGAAGLGGFLATA
jgi:Ca2+-binding EF-hand superfamily protein